MKVKLTTKKPWGSIGQIPGSLAALAAVALTAISSQAEIQAATDVWSGSVSTDWDTATANWLVNGNAGTYTEGDAVTFNDSSATQDVFLTGSFSPASVIVSSSADYLFEGTGSLNGATGITKSGTGKLTINTANAFTGPVLLQQGTISLGNGSALGTAPGSITVSSGATLDINAQNIKNEAITVSGTGVDGNGALKNSGGDTYGDSGYAAANITLVGDTTFGYDHRWDLGSSAVLSTGGKPYNLTLMGNSYREFVCTIDPKLANINVMEGQMGVKTALGDPNGTVTVAPGCQLVFWGGSGYAKKYHVQGEIVTRYDGPNFDLDLTCDDGATFTSVNNTKTFTRPIVLNGQVHFQIGDSVTTISNTISGTGGFYYDNYTSGTLLLTGRNTYSGDTSILQGAGQFILDGANVGGGLLSVAQSTTVTGNGTNSGPVILDGALQPGRSGTVGTFTTGPLTVESTGTVVFDVATGSNDIVTVNGDLNVSATTPFTINGQLSPGTYRLVNYTGRLIGSFNTNLSSSGLTVTINTNTAHQINLIVAGTPNNLRWIGASMDWDVNTSTNWVNTANGKPATYNQFDNVLFDDSASASQTIVWLDSVVTPTSITVDSSVNNYTFGGNGYISGGASLTKKGTGTLILTMANDFTGPITVQGGVLTASAGNAYGSGNGGTVAITNATFDVYGTYLGNRPIVVSGAGVDGNGAIVNSFGDVYGLSSSISLAGDTTFGGNRWDLSGGSVLNSGGNPYNLTITGGYRELSGVRIDSALGNIDIKSTVGLKDLVSLGNPTNTLTIEAGAEVDYWSGNGPDKVFHLMSGSMTKFLSGDVFTNAFVIEDGAQFQMIWGGRTFTGPITLNGIAHFELGDGNCTFSNVVSGSGGFLWDMWNHTLLMTASNTYQGPTLIGGGLTVALAGNGSISGSTNIFFGGSDVTSVHIDASARTDGTLTLANGQNLLGAGKVTGKMVVGPGATLTPGTNTTIGGISASDAITLNGVTALKIDLGSATNDIVASDTALNYGGTLAITVQNGDLTAGSSFKLFNASSYTGSFSSISPANPASGLYWDTSRLAVDGTLAVSATPVATVVPARVSASFADGALILQGATTNGTAGGTFVVLTQTNVAAPLSQWVPVLTNTFGTSGAFSNNIVVDPAKPQTYYIIQSK